MRAKCLDAAGVRVHHAANAAQQEWWAAVISSGNFHIDVSKRIRVWLVRCI
jgi:hypothetical protein